MSNKKERSDLLAMQEMVENNMDIACAVDITNYQRQPKMKGGTVTVGVASPYFDHLINQAALPGSEQTHYAILYIINKEQFDKLKKG